MACRSKAFAAPPVPCCRIRSGGRRASVLLSNGPILRTGFFLFLHRAPAWYVERLGPAPKEISSPP